MAEICKILGIAKTHTTPYHPQGDGLVERFNRTLLNMLSVAANDHPFNREEQLRPLCLAYNTSINSTTGFSPFFQMFGRQVHMPVDLIYGPPPQNMEKPTTEFTNGLRNKLERGTRTNRLYARLPEGPLRQKGTWRCIQGG